MLTRENAIDSIIAIDPAQDFPVMASGDVELLINRIYDDFEAQLKAKDEEIIKLYNKFGEANEKSVRDGYALGITKARSIVAMLFWKYVRSRTRFPDHKEQAYLRRIFEEAYKMLKDKA